MQIKNVIGNGDKSIPRLANYSLIENSVWAIILSSSHTHIADEAMVTRWDNGLAIFWQLWIILQMFKVIAWILAIIVVFESFNQVLCYFLDIEQALCVNAGELLDSKVAFQLALGNIDPFTLKKMDNWHPDERVTVSITLYWVILTLLAYEGLVQPYYRYCTE